MPEILLQTIWPTFVPTLDPIYLNIQLNGFDIPSSISGEPLTPPRSPSLVMCSETPWGVSPLQESVVFTLWMAMGPERSPKHPDVTPVPGWALWGTLYTVPSLMVLMVKAEAGSLSGQGYSLLPALHAPACWRSNRLSSLLMVLSSPHLHICPQLPLPKISYAARILKLGFYQTLYLELFIPFHSTLFRF